MDYFGPILSAGGLSLALFVAFLAADAFLVERLPVKYQRRSRELAIVILAGTVMLFHFHGESGLILDQRGGAIAVATAFGGPVIGLLVAVAVALIRLSIGGPAVMAGLVGIVADLAVCLVVFRLMGVRRQGSPVRISQLLGLGLAVGTTDALSLLLVPPAGRAFVLFEAYGPGVFGVQVVSTCLFGWLVTLYLDRRAGQRARAMLELEQLALSRGLASTPIEFTLKFALDGAILEANQAYARRSGYELAELKTMNLAGLKVLDEGETVPALFDRIRAAGRMTYESRHRTRDGEVWPAEVTSVYDDAGDYVLAFLRDITERKQAERHLAEKSADLQHALVQTIEALSSALGCRDLASEGHAQKVQDLSVRIGRAIGLDDDRLEGLRLAATVHNIGQIQTPAEILNRPRALGAEEMDLIRQHPVTGHAILRDIHFPWPIADIVLQHHENYDGSGYPAGLSGDDILLDARIIRVADSVAAMLSHRPFRRARDLDYVLDELRRGAGHQFDPEVAEICRQLLAEGHYVFPALQRRNA